MKVFALLLSSVIIVVTSSTSANYASIEEQLMNITKQLDRFEIQLNQSFHYLLNRIDHKTDDIMNLIKDHRSTPIDVSSENDSSSNRPINALLIIDVQNDFINGSLALRNCPSKHNGEEVIPVINQLLASIEFDVIVYSIDWHPTNHISFYDNLPLRAHLLTNDSIPLANLSVYSTATFAINGLPRMEQILWPRHCVQESVGAQMHPDLKLFDEQTDSNKTVIHIYKGSTPDIDSYSAFWNNLKLSETNLHKRLKEKHVTQVFVTGLATDWCVYSTALHAIEHGYKTFIIKDASRGVDETHIKERLADFIGKKGHLIHSDQVKQYTGL